MPKVEPFERYPARYEDWFERNRFAYESELLAIKAQLPESGKGIEIGVGSGRFAAPLAIGVGVEPSSKMREIARRRGIEVVDGVAEDLPFEDSSFDYALMITTLCFLDDVEAALKEAHRITKPGGVIIIGFIDKNSPLGKLYQRHKDDNVFYRVATFYSVDEVVHHLKRAGFRDLRFTQTIFSGLSEITDVEPTKEGHGEGSFVVVRGKK
ncbi:MAG: class I SAM-dependent methyltransferase [Thermoplasmata archaeon]|nr:class I SAM-dependent methyltransferase [Thermoplasmata archaeon]